MAGTRVFHHGGHGGPRRSEGHGGLWIRAFRAVSSAASFAVSSLRPLLHVRAARLPSPVAVASAHHAHPPARTSGRTDLAQMRLRHRSATGFVRRMASFNDQCRLEAGIGVVRDDRATQDRRAPPCPNPVRDLGATQDRRSAFRGARRFASSAREAPTHQRRPLRTKPRARSGGIGAPTSRVTSSPPYDAVVRSRKRSRTCKSGLAALGLGQAGQRGLNSFSWIERPSSARPQPAVTETSSMRIAGAWTLPSSRRTSRETPEMDRSAS